MNGASKESAGAKRSPASESTVQSYHKVAASPEAYAAEMRAESGGPPGRVLALVRRERDWLVGTARERGRSLLVGKMAVLADTIDDVAEVLHNSAQKLSARNDFATAHYFSLAAGGFGRVASTLRSPDLETMVDKSRDFARTHPAFFFGGMATAGFMVSRFLRSSPDGRQAGFQPLESGAESKRENLEIKEEVRRLSKPYGGGEKAACSDQRQ